MSIADTENRDFTLNGQIVDVVKGTIFSGEITIVEGKIAAIHPSATTNSCLILPGLVDAHVHIESSMLPPSEFARLATVHGTVATISDPHEIGNVLGVDGVEYMLQDARKVPFKFNFGAPSCVPATCFETAGACIGKGELKTLLERSDILYLAEMMNFPGVLNQDSTVMEKIAIAKCLGKPIDGHSPGLRGEKAQNYIREGITTDHECFSLDEAVDKLKHGMNIIIREGSAAKNFDTLIPVLTRYPDRVMFCSDDKHPDALVYGHINKMIAKALTLGYEPMSVFRAATLNPIRHYGLNVGLLQLGDPADLIVVRSLDNFQLERTYVNGVKVAENGLPLLQHQDSETVNHFNCQPIGVNDVTITSLGRYLRAIRVIDGQLTTQEVIVPTTVDAGKAISNVDKDTIKLVVVNRYKKAKPAIAFVHGFGIKCGAIASSIAHDCHNIIAAGVNDNDIVAAINEVITNQGGLSFVCGTDSDILPLPIAGLMSNNDGYQVADRYKRLDALVKHVGSKLTAPFMTLSFLALLVIPELKLSDQGLFNGNSFSFVDLFV